jgi:YegS/Rv2252/BmrU family lipid kinase
MPIIMNEYPEHRLAFIINPIAGGKNGNDTDGNRDKRSRQIIEKSANVTVRKTIAAGEAVQIAKEFAMNGYDVVVAVGGDGTVNEVARGLLEAQQVQHRATLGIIPRGSGNGLARHLGKATQTTIDHATINNLPFFCTAGIGFDALVSKNYAARKKRGADNYVKTALSAFWGYKPSTYQIIINGKTFKRTAFLITFANASQWGNNGYIAPMADISDGFIDVVIVKKFPLVAIPRLVYQLMNKKLHNNRYVEYFKCEQVKVTTTNSTPINAHADGEPLTLDTAEIEVKVYKQSLTVKTF